MKIKYTSFLGILTVSFLVASSCKRTETEPVEGLTKDLVYDTTDLQGTNAKLVLNDLYTYLPNGFNRIDNNLLCAASDDAISSAEGRNIELLSLGFQNPNQTVDDVWAKSYEAIRKANSFLANIDKVPVTPTNPLTKINWKAEARFIRAMSYFELIKRYGGVVLIGDQVFKPTDNVNIPRDDFNKCVQYVVSECDAIKPLLPTEPVIDTDFGRVTRAAAIALKSRILLYSASPLNNSGNDLTKWQLAADAAKELIDLNRFTLGTTTGTAAFRSVFTTRNHPEIILAYQRAKGQDIEKNNAPIGYEEPNASKGFTSPTQQLVNSFGTSKGLSITTDLKTTGNLTGYDDLNPYANRDPRFYATIFYNGSQWLQRNVETFEGGLDKPNKGVIIQTRTGYYMRKFMADFSTNASYSNQDHNFIIFRYAEILLNYAESMNEVSASNTTIAYTQLINIRKRAGITPGTNNLYGLKANMTQSEMRTAIKLERRIEMAFEEQRFWDVRRWKEAGVLFNQQLKGVKITRVSGTDSYQYPNVSPIIFYDRMYKYPIPFQEILKNKSLTQNPGY